jgi:hypothetical protein
MNCRNCLALAVLVVLSLISGSTSKAEPSREDVEKAWIGTWVGDWQSREGDPAGRVKLVVHSNNNGNVSAVIAFLSGSPAFGTDAFVPRVSGAPSPDSLTFSGERNGASFTLPLQIMANAIELKTTNTIIVDNFPDALLAKLIKQ